jgi:fatty acid desaturase
MSEDHPSRREALRSNRLVPLLTCNTNYDLEHHLYPAIPWYNLPKLNAMLRHGYRAAGTSVYTSYLAFLGDAGVHVYAPAGRRTGANS